jgi:hypothetical protein
MKLKPTVDIETLLVNLPDALAEVTKLPDIESWWLDLAFGVTPALMVRYDVANDPKVERIRLWSTEQLAAIWAAAEARDLDPNNVLRLAKINVRRLNAWQRSTVLHPFTCGGERTDEHHLDGEGILVATAECWICPFCTYEQAYSDFEVKLSSTDPGNDEQTRELARLHHPATHRADTAIAKARAQMFVVTKPFDIGSAFDAGVKVMKEVYGK